LAKKFHSLALKIFGVFCAPKIVLGFMKSAMPEQNFEHLVIFIAF
jgi:hypothetical protein